MSKVSKKVTFTILSISLLTVMAGAAMAPALGIIREHFHSYSSILVQLIVSLPAFFIIVSNLCFSTLCRFFRTKTIATIGLLLYVCAGMGAYFFDNIWIILCLRAVLGISVGFIMPLSTGLLSYYFPPEEQAHLMGLSAAMNQMGGVVATLLAGFLATVSWNLSFFVYGLGLISLVLVLLFLPNEKLISRTSKISAKTLVRFHPSVIGMLLLMSIFFIFPTNFAITAKQSTSLSSNQITLIMVGLDVIAFFVGLGFGGLMNKFRVAIKYFAPCFFFLGYMFYVIDGGVWGFIIGSLFIGIANGVGIPYLNTIASIKGGKDSATTVMPLLSASLYLGQFISPLIVSPLSKVFFSENDLLSPYKIGMFICIIFFIQVYTTRHFQSLPPERK